jgi:hypothetical protein
MPSLTRKEETPRGCQTRRRPERRAKNWTRAVLRCSTGGQDDMSGKSVGESTEVLAAPWCSPTPGQASQEKLQSIEAPALVGSGETR